MTIQEINAALAAARAAYATHQAQRVANAARYADWMREYRGPGHSQEADTALASCAADKAMIDAQIVADEKQIKDLEAQLKNAQEQEAAMATARAKAAAEGLEGPAAEKRAEQILQREKAKTVAIVVAVGTLAFVVALWAWLKFRKKK